jgi:hypothetical protein
MNASEILALLGRSAGDPAVQSLFRALGTDRRPSLDRGEDGGYYDWLLLKWQGVELGFTDSAYHRAEDRIAWGSGELLLTQAYFYSALEGGQAFSGALPERLHFGADRWMCRRALEGFESTRHSHLSDTWDVHDCRLTVAYKNDLLDRLICRVLPAPMVGVGSPPATPSVESIVAAFGETLSSAAFETLWGVALDSAAREQARTDGQIDFTASLGATLGFSGHHTPVFRSALLHRNRDFESVGWSGQLPNSLSFEDSPEILYSKMGDPAVKGVDSPLTGYAIWHCQDYSIHVLYSNVDNRLLRVKLLAPGTWKSVKDT